VGQILSILVDLGQTSIAFYFQLNYWLGTKGGEFVGEDCPHIS